MCIRDSGYHKSYLRDSLPEGVNQLTVFDGSGRILCERLFFLFPKPFPSDTIGIMSETSRLTPCGKMCIRDRACGVPWLLGQHGSWRVHSPVILRRSSFPPA